MKKLLLIASLFLCTSHDIYSMGKEFLLKNDVGRDADCVSVALTAAKSFPFLEKVINEHTDIGWAPQMVFVGSDKEDLNHVKEYIIRYHQMKKTCDPNDKEAEEKLYHYAKDVSTEKLMRLTYNASTNLFPLNVPWGLVNPLVKKMIVEPLSPESKELWRQIPAVKDALEKKVSKFSTKNESNRDLLIHPIQNDKQKNVITCLLAPYVQTLHQSTELPSYPKSFCKMFYTPIVEYVYVGDTITASLAGTSLPACPHYNYVLTIHLAEDCVQQVKLNDKELDFDVKGAFANKDESLFVCPYRSPYEEGKEGILLVDIATGNSQQIACSGKTIACFNNDGKQLLSFDDAGKIFMLSDDHREWQLLWDTEISGMQGMLSDPINKMLICWNGEKVYDVKNDPIKNEHNCITNKEKKAQFSRSSACKWVFYQSGILDVVMDSAGTKLCIKTGKSSDESVEKYFLVDFSETNLPVELATFRSTNSCASFSSCGNLLIISSGKDDVVTHDYFNTAFPHCSGSSFPLLSFLQKKSVGRLLAAGKGKVIVQEETVNYCHPQCITLADQNMSDGLNLLVNPPFNPFKPHIYETTGALFRHFTGQEDKGFNYDPKIETLFPKQPVKNIVIETSGIYTPWKSFYQMMFACRTAISNHRIALSAAALILVAGIYIKKCI